MISDLPIVKMEDENKKQLWTFLVLYFINKNQYFSDTNAKHLFTPRRTMDVLRIMLHVQPALSPLLEFRLSYY